MYRVLIADDEMLEKMVLHKTLQDNFGDTCEIYEAENGRRAIEEFEKHDVQIAILDIEMPGINGIEAAMEMKKQKPECCIIFLTAFDEFSYAKQAITIKAMEYLLKPYDTEELLLVMEEAMRITDSFLSGRIGVHTENPKEDTETLQEYELKGEDVDNIRMSAVYENILGYIKNNYKSDISMQDVAKAMNYSETYFCRLFKQCFNKNFTSYLTEYRINEAKKLLEHPLANVKNIGETVGYFDSNYFTKVFKRVTGMNPTEYRKHCGKTTTAAKE